MSMVSIYWRIIQYLGLGMDIVYLFILIFIYQDRYMYLWVNPDIHMSEKSGEILSMLKLIVKNRCFYFLIHCMIIIFFGQQLFCKFDRLIRYWDITQMKENSIQHSLNW